MLLSGRVALGGQLGPRLGQQLVQLVGTKRRPCAARGSRDRVPWATGLCGEFSHQLGARGPRRMGELAVPHRALLGVRQLAAALGGLALRLGLLALRCQVRLGELGLELGARAPPPLRSGACPLRIGSPLRSGSRSRSRSHSGGPQARLGGALRSLLAALAARHARRARCARRARRVFTTDPEPWPRVVE